uniref:protein-tyrosine-phosphatase n=1 Tax=Trieres chinensis TaxID=1514140 RepID=A0A7S2A7J1_TRICV|mmetsp:Transcript_5560/g.11583  ORF Transcript_5560/g.11583 Transcript_5560/m.11583 type:complete len:212 (+) Transcript_5560:43-678(+)
MSSHPLFPLDSPPTRVHRLEHTQAHTILDGRLYLSPALAAMDEEALRGDGITHVLNTAKDVPTQQFESIKVLHLQIYDSPEQILPFEQAACFIAESLAKGGKCLVHCVAGQSRSASVVIYFLMTQGYSLKETFSYVKERKPDIRLNFGFASQLEDSERRLHGGKSTLDMTEYKVDSLLEILEGSGKSREDVRETLRCFQGNAELALGALLD